MFNKEKKSGKGKVPGKETDHRQGLISLHGIGKVSNCSSRSQPRRSLRQDKGTFEMYNKPKGASSLMTEWSHNPLMDHKQLVLMIFKQDAYTGRPSFDHKENNLALITSTTLKEDKKPLKTLAVRLKSRQTCSTSVRKVWKGQDPREQQQLKEQVPHISHSNQSINNSISGATVMFADFGSAGGNVKKSDGKNVFKSGPDPTQLSSVLLELRERVRFNSPPYYFLIIFCFDWWICLVFHNYYKGHKDSYLCMT